MPSGLRTVTDDMKAMNRKDKAGIMSSGENKAYKSAPSTAKDGPPKLELVMSHKKVNSIIVDKCTRMGVVFTVSEKLCNSYGSKGSIVSGSVG
ncbi:hypothetical protein Tco_1198875 [Tanacetum coccineum]